MAEQEQTPVSAKNLIQGYEKGEAFKSGEIKPSEKPEISELLAKNVISDFEAGKMYGKGEHKSEKPEINEHVTKQLISSFEKGDLYKPNDRKGDEKIVARPGVTKKLQKIYEGVDEPKSPTIPKSPSTKTTPEEENSVGVIKEPAKKKTVLLVYAHWERKGSFNGAMQDVAENTLRQLGYNVLISDLYAMKWNPCVSFEDIKDFAHDQHDHSSRLVAEMLKAVEEDRISPDIAAEHKKVRAADLIIFQYPMAWLSYPAILKGWFDRVLCNGFAFLAEKMKLYDEGFLKGKKAVLSFTTGGVETAYCTTGINGDIEIPLWAMQYGALRFSGFDMLAPQICYGITLANEEKRKEHLSRWAQRLHTIMDEEPLSFVHLSNFDLSKGLVLSDKYLESADEKNGFSVGQHRGLPFPAGSMTGLRKEARKGKL